MPSGPRRIGEILIDIGAISNERLEEALRAQAQGGERLGRILVDRKLVTQAQLERALSVQKGEQVPALEAGAGHDDPAAREEDEDVAAISDDGDDRRALAPAELAALLRGPAGRFGPQSAPRAARRAEGEAPTAVHYENPLAELREAARALEATVPAAAAAQVYAALVQAAIESGRFRLDDFLRALGVERGATA